MSSHSERRHGVDGSPRDLLVAAVAHAGHLLPAQGPIGTFIHHNTLHAYQSRPFHEAIAAACDLYDAEGYLPEERYREAWTRGRIDDADVERALARRGREVPDRAVGPLTVRRIEWLALRHGIHADSPTSFRWFMDELEGTHRVRDGVSTEAAAAIVAETIPWLSSLDGAGRTALGAMLAPRLGVDDVLALAARDPVAASLEALWGLAFGLAPVRPDQGRLALLARVGIDRTPRDLLIALGAPDPAELSNGELIRFLGAHLDEGMARWSLPGRDRGLLASFREYAEVARAAEPTWFQRAIRRLASAAAAGKDATDVCLGVLAELGVEPAHFETFVPRLLLALPGWTGMVARLEHSPEDRAPGAPPVSLLELTAIRLVLDVEAMQSAAREAGHLGPLTTLVDHARAAWAREDRRRAHDGPYRLFQLCQLAGISAPALERLGRAFAEDALAVLDGFDPLARRRWFHDAYEQHHLDEWLGAVVDNRRRPAGRAAAEARFQVAFCIDDREEAIRRHFEALGADHQTFGVAGFFGVAMQYRSLDDPNPSALCPAVVKPSHAIVERPVDESAEAHERRLRLRAVEAWWRQEISDGSRSFFRGALLTPALGLFALAPMASRVLMPRLSANLSARLRARVLPEPTTELALARVEDEIEGAAPPDATTSLARGFALRERVERVAATLENIGLTSGFAPVVALLGHRASTTNNPHHSAYDCGACGGRSGGPNARAFAAMANEPGVREGLAARGIVVPSETWFIGGVHDTTTDGITFFDLGRVPASARPHVDALVRALDQARTMSAHERCRKFEHAPLGLTPERALAHVEERSVDLSQARPELGHATNAVCVVGRRALTRGLFLDRRSFLVSYDPAIDEGGRILERILAAVVPVGAGISLEYYFSTVDPDRWGCGTKLPHDLACLLGVMEGANGDLRTGLPRQMTEIHEPVRLLCIVEATPETILAIGERRDEVKELVTKGWVRLGTIDPTTGQAQVLGPDGFEPFDPGDRRWASVARSVDWYGGSRDALAPARLDGGGDAVATHRTEAA